MATLEVGTEIDAYCAKCESVGRHSIVAMRGTRAARTKCAGCESVHAYRKNPPGTRSGTPHTPQQVARRAYDKAVEGRDLSNPIAYRFSHKFKADDVLNHKKFGIGLVTRLLSDNKMEVVFPEYTKVLVFNR